MNQEDNDYIAPCFEQRPNTGDKLHALQLLRDLVLINERTAQVLGPLPIAGLPAALKRKPNLPHLALQKVDDEGTTPKSPAVNEQVENAVRSILTLIQSFTQLENKLRR